MLSQIEGNMTHLRRLRSNMGSGQQLSAGTTNAVYLAAYDDLNRVSGDASGQGIRRSEWGGMLGFESRMSSESLGGFALSNGWARVNPSGAGTRRYHEEATRLDFYVVGRLGDGWHSVTSLGVGRHDFSLRRELTDGVSAKAGDMEGYSMNLQQEISYSSRIDEQSSMETFLAVESSVNHIIPHLSGFAPTDHRRENSISQIIPHLSGFAPTDHRRENSVSQIIPHLSGFASTDHRRENSVSQIIPHLSGFASTNHRRENSVSQIIPHLSGFAQWSIVNGQWSM